ncbi:hypothetical protein HDU98_011435 [Podochytrium sp. JEL0797]|nr:hypothetical protein HDU98_011435 [Podochytrium sp. JEL0797]
MSENVSLSEEPRLRAAHVAVLISSLADASAAIAAAAPNATKLSLVSCDLLAAARLDSLRLQRHGDRRLFFLLSLFRILVAFNAIDDFNASDRLARDSLLDLLPCFVEVSEIFYVRTRQHFRLDAWLALLLEMQIQAAIESPHDIEDAFDSSLFENAASLRNAMDNKEYLAFVMKQQQILHNPSLSSREHPFAPFHSKLLSFLIEHVK